ncbi:MAG: phage shock protein PspC (stress-responsive transcriptional regulator) [Mariniflexile sp.]|jgi:phage shock protein PspC (stress-responsive transcriptional regulator)
MNKTVNINLAGVFFHIDEDAYLKLQRYLDAIKRSFTDSQGRSEIIADIEARIAELFSERVQNDKQVIRIKEVDEVISIMGQPEDYLVDDEIFEDNPKSAHQRKSSVSKKLFRDRNNSYIAGVASGLGHYLGIDAVWIRLIWILFTIGSGGTFIFIYILFWILVPEAKTTAEKIIMTGEPVNISNIEKKIKDGFETVSETVSGVAKNVSDAAKNVDLQKQGSKIKSSSKSFFDTIAEIIMFFFKIFAKFVGIILIIVGASAIIALIIGWFSVGVANIVNIPGMDLVDIANSSNSPIWLASLLAFFAIGIPFFFLFYLGLKILINNLKSIGNIAKFTLLGLWLFSIIGLIIMGIRQASEHAFNERVIEKQELYVTTKDTLLIKMSENELFRHRVKVANNENGEKIIYSSDVNIIVKSTTDSLAYISIEKSADGRNYDKAVERAKNIDYNFELKGNELLLDSYLSTASKNKFSDQELLVTLYLPESSIIKFNDNTRDYLSYHISSNYVNHYLNITENGMECNDCDEDNFELNIDIPNVRIDENGIEIKGDKSTLKIDDNGIKAESKDVKVNIDSDGINIKSDN